MELKEMIEAQNKVFDEFKKTNDERIAKLAKGEAVGELEGKLAKLNAKLDEFGSMSEMKSRMDKLDVAMQRMGQSGNAGEANPDQKAHRDAILSYIRKGHMVPADVEKKALSVQSDPDGGFTVHADLNGRIIKKVFETSPIRSVANVQTISTDALEGVYDLGEAGSGWVSETGTRSTTDTPQIGTWRIPVHELYAKPKATQKLLDDSAVDIEAWLAGKVSEKFGRDENTAFVLGSGNGRPRGFMTYASGTTLPGTIQQVGSGSSGAFTSDGLVSLVYALKSEYRKNAVFGLARDGIAAVRKLKGTQNDHYIWQPGFGSEPSTLMGYPVIEMNDIAAIAAGSLSAVFGNFMEGYQIVDRQGIRTLRDPYSAKPYVEFYTTKRVGGGVVNFEALKIQVLT